jgi:hypothetical protein
MTDEVGNLDSVTASCDRVGVPLSVTRIMTSGKRSLAMPARRSSPGAENPEPAR